MKIKVRSMYKLMENRNSGQIYCFIHFAERAKTGKISAGCKLAAQLLRSFFLTKCREKEGSSNKYKNDSNDNNIKRDCGRRIRVVNSEQNMVSSRSI